MLDIPIRAATAVRGTTAAAALFAPDLAGAVRERLCAAHLDGALGLLKLTRTMPLSAGQVEVPMRRLMRDALSVDARAMVLAHNHPGGCTSPSPADLRTTRRIAELGRMLGITLVDHLLFAGGEVVSFRALGLL